MLDASDHTGTSDDDWHTLVTIELAPDPRLTADQQAVVAHDYDMTDGKWQLSVRAKLLSYLLQLLRLDPMQVMEDPRAQQIIIVNQGDVKAWLFPSG